MFSVDILGTELQYLVVAGFLLWHVKDAPKFFGALKMGWGWFKHNGFRDVYRKLCEQRKEIEELKARITREDSG